MAKKVKKTKKKTTKKKTAKKTKKKSPSTNPKKTIKKTARKKFTSRKRRNSLKPEDVQRFRDLLLIKRAEIIGDVNAMEAEALRKSRLDAAGDLSSMPIHMADIGTDNFEQEFALGLMDSERKILAEINDALGRIELGTYGICEGTGQPIPKVRLLANPWARYCIEYATMLEKGLVGEGQPISQDETEDQFEDDLDDSILGLEIEEEERDKFKLPFEEDEDEEDESDKDVEDDDDYENTDEDS